MFEKLNKILEEETSGETILDIPEYAFIQSLVNIVLSIKTPIIPREYHSKMRLQRSINYSLTFLDKINPLYADILDFVLKHNHITIKSRDDYPDKLSRVHLVNGKRHIELFYGNTIEDSYTLTHETMHYYNFDDVGMSDNWHLMTETFSILMELLQKKWFASFSIPKRDYKNNEIDTLYALKIKAIRLDFEIRLIITYLENGYIDEYLFARLLEGYNEFYAEEVEEDIIDVLRNDELNFSMLQRDIIGGCLSSYMYERILNKPSRIAELINLNEYVKEMDFEDSLLYLGLDFEDEETLLLDSKSLNKIKGAYVKRVKNMY